MQDRGDWKLVKSRPAHLQLPTQTNTRLPTIVEDAFDEEDLDDPINNIPARPITSYARTREDGYAPPHTHRNMRDGDGPPTEGDEVRPGNGELAPIHTAEGDAPPTIREAQDPVRTNRSAEPDCTNEHEGVVQPDQQVNGEYSPVNEYEDPLGKNLCRHCHTMIKLTTGHCTYNHYCNSRGYQLAADPDNKVLGIINRVDQLLARVAYICGLDNHHNRDHDDAIAGIETAITLTDTPDPPSEESSTEGADDTSSTTQANSEHSDSEPDVPEYQVLHLAAPKKKKPKNN